MNQQEANIFLWVYQLTAAMKSGLPSKMTGDEADRYLSERFDNDSSLSTEESEQLRELRAKLGEETDLIRYHADGLINVLTPDWGARLKPIPVGTLPNLELNAETVRAPSGDPIIVVATGLAAMLFEAAALCAGATPLEGAPAEITLGDATRNIFQWTVFYVTRSPEWLPGEVFRSRFPNRRALIGGLYTNALNFVLGHEYGHAILGHLNNPSCEVRNIAGAGAPPLMAYDFSHQMEFEADAKGAEIALAFSKANHSGWIGAGVSGTHLALQILRLLEELFPSRTGPPTHPAAAKRLKRIHDAWRNEYGGETVDGLNQLTTYFDITAAVGRQILSEQ